MWTYPALAAALAAPEFFALSDLDAATILAAQTVQVVRDIPTAEILGILFSSGDWSNIAIAASKARAGTATDAASKACVTVEDRFKESATIFTSQSGPWTNMQALVAGLVTAAIISSGTGTALLALREVTMAVWDPIPSDHDVAAARALGA